MNIGLGRLVSIDDRDKAFPMKAALPAIEEDRKIRYWYQSAYWGNQGSTSHCVAHSWTHWLKDGPVTQKNYKPDQPELYRICQELDEWPGSAYEGTSVRAGAKALLSQGLIKEYLWTWNVEELAQAIIKVGPVVVGTNWYRDMSKPIKGIAKPTGMLDGGHAYLINGVNINKGMFRLKNSWGRGYGKNGNAYISFEDIQTLLNQDGECCLAIEAKIENN
ncbi:MAG: C1 family peptidase [Segetibacter sp.]